MRSLAHWLRVLRCSFGFGDHVKSIARLSRTATACLALNAEHEFGAEHHRTLHLPPLRDPECHMDPQSLTLQSQQA